MTKAHPEHLPLPVVESGDPGGALIGPTDPVPEALSSDSAALLLSIKPEFAAAILAGEKTVELRRRPPTTPPPVIVIYASGKGRTVLGTAQLDAVHTATPEQVWAQYGTQTGITRSQFDDYFAGSPTASALLLSAAHPAESAMSLSDLRQIGLEPPQSWRYMSTRQLTAVMGALSTDLDRGRAQKLDARAPSRDNAALPSLWCWINEKLDHTVRQTGRRPLPPREQPRKVY